MRARTSGQAFPAARHVRRRAEFQRVYELGERVRARLMTVIVLPNEQPFSRLGIAATKKLGGAVVRNRAKRLVREVFRRAHVPPGLDIVVIPRPEMLDAEYRVIEAEFGYVLRRAGRTTTLREGRPELAGGTAGAGRGARVEQRLSRRSR